MSAAPIGMDEIHRLVDGDRRPGDVIGADQLELSPDAGRLAFCATLVAEDGTTRRRVAVLDLTTRSLELVGDVAVESHGPVWSPDGRGLAWLSAAPDGSDVVRVETFGDPVAPAHTGGPTTSSPGSGTAEFVRWSPDGTRLLTGVATPGAARSDVVGSGVVAGGGDEPSWRPLVEHGPPDTGRRRLVVHHLSTGVSEPVPVAGNVWEACWAGDAAVVCVVSQGPDESDWYQARLVRCAVTPSLDAGRADRADGPERERPVARRLVLPPGQVAAPAASPDGQRVSVIVGAMSDRGLDSGGLWVDGRIVDTLKVDVTWQRWVDDHTVHWAGVRGLRTVVGSWDTRTGTSTEVWATDDTCGTLNPSVAAVTGTVVAYVHGHARPPVLLQLRPDERVLFTLDVSDAPVGVTTRRTWVASDGVEIEGLLTRPTTAGPHPLVVLIHGGPVWSWRNTWSMNHPYTVVLVAAGYAVLHPNSRGSTGRGQEFVRAGLTDMGGLDADDLHRGVDALIADGVVDAARVAVTGNSYGGYVSAWLLTLSDRFAAAIARSPVTDWVSQHHTSNLAGFDRLCFAGDSLAPDSVHRARSPLYAADRIRTPILLTAGARDLGTPASQAVVLHRALTERGRDSTLVVYPEEGHGVRGRDALADQCHRMLAFLRTHLGDAREP